MQSDKIDGMRTTIRLDDELLREAKRIAAESDRTLTEVIEDSLRETFAGRKAAANQAEADLPVWKGSKLLAGIDLDRTAALLDFLERTERDERED
jgi:hypothetical protein